MKIKIRKYKVMLILAFLFMWLGALLVQFIVPGAWYFVPAVITYIMSICVPGFLALFTLVEAPDATVTVYEYEEEEEEEETDPWKKK